MIYFEIILQTIAILVGIIEIYNKRVKKKNYQEENFIILVLALFYSMNSEEKIVSWLVFIVAIIILIIMIDKVINVFNIKKGDR